MLVSWAVDSRAHRNVEVPRGREISPKDYNQLDFILSRRGDFGKIINVADELFVASFRSTKVNISEESAFGVFFQIFRVQGW